ncbi:MULTISPECIES: baseplate J/gp47 family protein [unclassified Rhizobium]|uniref:baseplate J/gp47 family protein n=1 Tax=unclassified Rhizobium TaxID=2613769 RepID=UPI00382F51D8
MAATPVATVDATGIHLPSYNDVLTYLETAYKNIYGQDIYIDPDSQDGELLAIFALAISDANSMAAAVYNAFSPATAQGAGLASVVKINGISKNIASYSTVDLALIGQAGTTITNGVTSDEEGNQWNLPSSVTIPPGGAITVTATAAAVGAFAAGIGTVTTIATPTRGWQSVSNPSAATPGAPVESDAALRKRQTTSTALPSNTILEGIVGAIAALQGVTRYAAYENDTDSTDANGIPSHSIALIIEGGDAQTIANTIAKKKTPGAGTFGSVSETVIDAYGVPHIIKLSRPTSVEITVAITLKALPGYTSSVQTSISQAAVNYINSTAIGGAPSGTVEWDSAIAAAKSVPGAATFRITSLTLSRASGAGTPDVPIAFNEAGTASLADVTFTVT